MKSLIIALFNKDYLFLQIAGCCGIVFATYLLSYIAAIYVASGLILIWGVVLELTKESKKNEEITDGNR